MNNETSHNNMVPQENFQLTLPVGLDDEATFANFLVIDANRQLFAELSTWNKPASRFEFLWLWGKKGSGCSHLLQALCHQLDDKGLRAVYVPLQEHAQIAVDMLSGLESLDIVCLDGMEAVAGLPDWEHALFRLYNLMLARKVRLVVSAGCAPAQLNVTLPDLASRMQTALVFQLHALDDEGKKAALQLRARSLGFDLPDEVVRYLLDHYSREASRLFAVLGQLDKLSLQRKRRITLPLLKELLQGSAQ
ncbi:MAG: DnaA regulatory inactivator Hda [Pseudomonadales bacterium]|nr:DnaA regulatory inactivator Hda [Pseudomonadales bacterium]